MAEKIAKLGIVRDDKFLYFIREREVVRTPRQRPKGVKNPTETLATIEAEIDRDRYLYFVDQDGDVARVERKSYLRRSKARSTKKKMAKKAMSKKTKRVGDALARERTRKD
jgi:hypothetical protein